MRSTRYKQTFVYSSTSVCNCTGMLTVTSNCFFVKKLKSSAEKSPVLTLVSRNASGQISIGGDHSWPPKAVCASIGNSANTGRREQHICPGKWRSLFIVGCIFLMDDPSRSRLQNASSRLQVRHTRAGAVLFRKKNGYRLVLPAN